MPPFHCACGNKEETYFRYFSPNLANDIVIQCEQCGSHKDVASLLSNENNSQNDDSCNFWFCDCCGVGVYSTITAAESNRSHNRPTISLCKLCKKNIKASACNPKQGINKENSQKLTSKNEKNDPPTKASCDIKTSTNNSLTIEDMEHFILSVPCEECDNSREDLFEYLFIEKNWSRRCLKCDDIMSVNDNLNVNVLQKGQILLCECGNNDLNNAMIEVDEKSLICLKCKKCICKLDELDDGNELNGASGKANDFATNVEDVVDEKKRKTYNKVTSFDQLKRGDHIMMECSRIGFSYWHHAIVTDVTKANTLIVIHYSSIDEERLVQLGLQSSEDLEKVTDRSFDKGQVIVEEIDWFYTGPTLYRVDYPKSICYSIEEVVSRAMQRLGERSYNLLLNNCEHFARWCKTGNLISEQISEYKNAIGKHIKSVLVILKELFGVPNLIKFIQANRPAATIASNLIDDAAVAINAQLTYPNLLPVGLAAVGVALSTIVDIALMIPDILKQRQLMKEGHITEKEYLLTRNAMLINCGATFGANLTITMAASLIGATLTPIPFVGPFLALMVSIAGSYFGVKLGKKFGNKLEAKYRERRTRIMVKSNSSDIVKKTH